MLINCSQFKHIIYASTCYVFPRAREKIFRTKLKSNYLVYVVYKYLCWSSFSWYVHITYRGPLNERGNPTTLYYNRNNSAMFLARENNKSKTYLQLFIQMTKTTNIYIYMKTRSAWCYIIHYYITLSF